MPKLAITQIECVVGDVDANISKACEMVAEAAGQGAEFVLTPEVTNSISAFTSSSSVTPSGNSSVSPTGAWKLSWW